VAELLLFYVLMIVQGSLGLLPSALGLLAFELAADANSRKANGNNPQMPKTSPQCRNAFLLSPAVSELK